MTLDGVSDVLLAPLALTRVDEHEACVAGVTSGGAWTRPQPIPATILDDAHCLFRYFEWVRVRLAPSPYADARPEDRALVGSPRPAGVGIEEAERAGFLVRHADRRVSAVFGEGRSLGRVEVQWYGLEARRATSGRMHLRARFRDGGGEEHDWIVADAVFGRFVWPHVDHAVLYPSFGDRLGSALSSSRTFLAIALTKPNPRFPGRFGGCHPLVVGVHALPGYDLVLHEVPVAGGEQAVRR